MVRKLDDTISFPQSKEKIFVDQKFHHQYQLYTPCSNNCQCSFCQRFSLFLISGPPFLLAQYDNDGVSIKGLEYVLKTCMCTQSYTKPLQTLNHEHGHVTGAPTKTLAHTLSYNLLICQTIYYLLLLRYYVQFRDVTVIAGPLKIFSTSYIYVDQLKLCFRVCY